MKVTPQFNIFIRSSLKYSGIVWFMIIVVIPLLVLDEDCPSNAMSEYKITDRPIKRMKKLSQFTSIKSQFASLKSIVNMKLHDYIPKNCSENRESTDDHNQNKAFSASNEHHELKKNKIRRIHLNKPLAMGTNISSLALAACHSI